MSRAQVEKNRSSDVNPIDQESRDEPTHRRLRDHTKEGTRGQSRSPAATEEGPGHVGHLRQGGGEPQGLETSGKETPLCNAYYNDSNRGL